MKTVSMIVLSLFVLLQTSEVYADYQNVSCVQTISSITCGIKAHWGTAIRCTAYARLSMHSGEYKVREYTSSTSYEMASDSAGVFLRMLSLGLLDAGAYLSRLSGVRSDVSTQLEALDVIPMCADGEKNSSDIWKTTNLINLLSYI